MLVTILLIVLILYLIGSLGAFALPADVSRVLGIVLVVFLIIYLIGLLTGHPMLSRV